MQTKDKYIKIIREKYNPDGETLSKDDFDRLFDGAEEWDSSAMTELFRKTCFFSYDMVAYLFSQKFLQGDFEDALQDTCLILNEAIYSNYKPKQYRAKYFYSPEKDYKKYLFNVAKFVYYGLKEKEYDDTELLAQHFSSLARKLENPEEVAMENLSREDLVKLINSLKFPGCRTEELRNRNRNFVKEVLIDGKTCTEVAKENNMSLSSVTKTIRHSYRVLRHPSYHAEEYLK